MTLFVNLCNAENLRAEKKIKTKKLNLAKNMTYSHFMKPTGFFIRDQVRCRCIKIKKLIPKN